MIILIMNNDLRNARWTDERGKRHNYSAMRYIDTVMSLCDACRKDQAVFPTKFGIHLFLLQKYI